MAAQRWATNADLVCSCAVLGYLAPVDGATVLDPTYGEGNWWTKWRPFVLIAHDKYKGDGVDFRKLPWKADTFDAVAFDPPYVCPGGRTTSTIKEFHARYGMDTELKTPDQLYEHNRDGMAECLRVLKPGGFLCYKSQDYVWGGKLRPITHYIIRDALEWDMRYFDRLEHVGNVRPQPPGRRQVHARRNLSSMLVFQKP